MKAEEIRARYERLKDIWTPEAQNKYWLLHEIAAQLAEMNENLYSIVPDGPNGRVLRTESVKAFY